MASTRLSRTPASAGSRTTWTWSAWIKLASFSGATFYLENAGSSGTNDTGISIEASSRLEMFNRISGSVTGKKTTSRKFRDTNAWYHIVVVWDTTNATADDRIRFYVNGERETAFDISTNPSSSENSSLNNNVAHDIGSVAGGGAGTYFDGEMTHVHFIDGTAYDASYFGETDSTTGIWKPKTAPSVTYGTNGFFLKFENSSSMGTDSSGNANNFTVNGTLTQTIDTPSNVFATLSPLVLNSGTLSHGNLTHTGDGSSPSDNSPSTLGVTKGKYYAEFKCVTADNQNGCGVCEEDDAYFSTSSNLNSVGYGYITTGSSFTNGTQDSGFGSTYTTGDIIGVALDMDNGFVYFSKNGTWQDSGDPTSGATGTGALTLADTSKAHFFIVGDSFFSANNVWSANFGNGYFGTTAVSSAQNPDDGIGIFEYDVPTGYRALCTKSINAEEYS